MKDMAEYKFQKEVHERAEQYIEALKHADFAAILLEHTFRDYTVKVAVEKSGRSLGNVNIYYSPKNNRYSLKLHELKMLDFASVLEQLWLQGEKQVHSSHPHRGLHAYVDGSFFNGTIGYGAVILQDGQVIQEFSGSVEDTLGQLTSMNQVGGEIEAVYKVLDWAVKTGKPEIEIYFDYKGLEAWVNGSYKANNLFTKKYQDFVRSCPVKTIWHKVEGHSGDRWNDRADELAKKGAQVNQTKDSTDLIKELEGITNEFIVFLTAKGIEAYFDGVYNGQHSRIKFSGIGGVNMLDIYNTKNVHLEPKWHGISDTSLKDKLQELWNRYKVGGVIRETEGETERLVQAIGSYIEKLRPYHDLHFDFIELAKMVEQLSKDRKKAIASAAEMRFDFAMIEKSYIQLLGEHHG